MSARLIKRYVFKKRSYSTTTAARVRNAYHAYLVQKRMVIASGATYMVLSD